MLTGRRAFEAEHDVAVAHSILHDDPDPPSAHRQGLSPALDDLVLRLLEKTPARRPSNATALLADLARVESTRPRFTHAVPRWWRRSSRAAKRHARLALAATAAVLVGAVAYAAAGGSSIARVAAPQRTTIAVLPFQNLTAADSHAYLAGGLHDEVLSQLVTVPSLKIIGPGSVSRYGGARTPPVQQIASELGAGTVVTGSVQVVGRRVRVHVQLVDPRYDRPLWVERYDRTLDDVLAIENDIARQVAATVGAVVSGPEGTATISMPAERTKAYLLYLQAKQLERVPGLEQANLEKAVRLYEEALALDPTLAVAHAALSIDHGYMYWLRYDMTPARLQRQRAEAETALRLAPNLPQSHEAMAKVHAVGPDGDRREGIKEIRIALRGAPNDSRLWRWLAAGYRTQGEWDEYEKAFMRAVELDPRDIDLLADYGGFTHQRMGRFADAIRWYDRAQHLVPDTIGFTIGKAWIQAGWTGDWDGIRAVLNSEPARRRRQQGAIYPLLNLRFLDRQPDSMLTLLKEARTPVFQATLSFEPVSLWFARAHELRGDTAAARAAWERALGTIDSALVKWPLDWPVHGARGLALARLGRRAEALEEVGSLRTNFIYRKDRFLRPFVSLAIARTLAALGDAGPAVEELGSVMSEHENGLTVHVLRKDPSWDRIRSDPRFTALLAEHDH
jgi:TolB-like protein/tetratricopeptide (TPR) repeat protein